MKTPPLSRTWLIVLWLLLPTAAARGQEWTLQLSERGLPVVARQRATLVSASLQFWGVDWQYASVKAQARFEAPGRAAIAADVRDLRLFLDAAIEPAAPNRLRYTWHVDPKQALHGVIGGGLEFSLNLDGSAAPGGATEPVLLDDSRGWSWPVGDGAEVRVEFDPALPKVYFERGRKSKIRAFFISGDAEAGRKTYTMTVTVPEGGAVVQSVGERYGPVDLKSWHADALRPHQSPVDLSFLNHRPAGKHGFVGAEGDRFVFEDGTPVRFWGGNLAAHALFTDKDAIAGHARRIAQLGYNLMRLHHHDSTGWVRPTVIDVARPDSQHLDEAALDRLDWWVKCLKDQGVYVWLDLHVGRLFKLGDEIDGFSDLDQQRGGGAEAKGFNYFNERIEELMERFNAQYLGHVNRYTGVAYKDEPAVMGVMITNENDITHHFGNLMLADKNNPHHQAIFERESAAFAARHDLDPDGVGQTWKPGPGKLFLADWEHAWNQRMIASLREIGVKVPIATTQMWGNMPLFGLPPLTAGDVIDVHSYGGGEALSADPRHGGNWVIDIAGGAAHGKPVAISEWNVPYPEVDRFTAPLYLASVAALQGWDAPMVYNYAQVGLGDVDRQDKWSTFTDPGITALMPAAALMYRRGDVREAQNQYLVQLDRQRLFFSDARPGGVPAIRSLVEQSKVTLGLPATPELPWLTPTEPSPGSGVIVVTDPDERFVDVAKGARAFMSDTDELTRDWESGWQRIDTPRSQAVQGWIGGETRLTRDVTFAVTTPKAAVAVTSLDGEPIAASKRVLITAVGRAQAGEKNRMPIYSEPIAGVLRIKALPGLSLHAIGGSGSDMGALEAPYEDGAYRVTLPPAKGTHWWELRGVRE